MRRILTLVVLACVVLSGIPAPAMAATDAPGTVPTLSDDHDHEGNETNRSDGTVTVLSYNDIQTAAAQNGTLPVMATLIDERRAAHDNPVFVMGAGDQIGPHALSPVSQWRAPVATLNEIGADVDTIGNHDLDYGVAGFREAAAASDFPWVATNFVNETTGEPVRPAKRTVVLEKQGLRVGVLGAIYPGLDGSVADDLEAQNLTVEPVEPTIQQYETQLREEENVDVVVVLLHTGTEQAVSLAKNTTVDAVLVGHDEVIYRPQVTSGTVVSEGQARAQYLSEINMTVENGEVVGYEGRLINVSASDAKADENVSAIIEEYRAEVALDSVVAHSEVPLDATFGTNYHRESNYGNLVTDAMRETADADVAITNAGGIRSNEVYGPGDITGGDVFNTLPFANTLVTVELTGAELEETLESQVITLGPDNPYGAEISQQVSGVHFEWNGATGEIRDLEVGGEPVDPEATYTVAVNSYMAGGGSGYPLENATRVSETDDLLAEVVVNYLKQQGNVETVTEISPEVEGRAVRYTTDLADRMVWANGAGTTVLRYERPANLTSVDADTFYATDGETRVNATSATVNGNSLVVQFESSDLQSLGTGSAEVYGTYTDSQYADSRAYWSGSVVNSDLVVFTNESAAFAAAA